MKNRTIEYQDGDQTLEGFLAWDAGKEGKRPAVLVAHAWAGRGEFECQVAEDLAALGYAGFALDNYGKGVLGYDNEENAALMSPFLADRGLLRRRLLAGLHTVSQLDIVDPSRIAAIGYCFGGLCVLDLARSGAAVNGVVSFHGLFNAPENLPSAPIKAKVLALHGHDDPMVPPAKVLELEQELTAAGVDWQIHAYGHTCHAFTNPAAAAPEQGMAYNPVSARRAWLSMKNFLAEVLE
ncbi:MAG: dienelactone hydrolase family protein [Pseudomonadales bacterium]|nr:dienelactone hydrolase family protein [Pseudomonadales bacterium]